MQHITGMLPNFRVYEWVVHHKFYPNGTKVVRVSEGVDMRKKYPFPLPLEGWFQLPNEGAIRQRIQSACQHRRVTHGEWYSVSITDDRQQLVVERLA